MYTITDITFTVINEKVNTRGKLLRIFYFRMELRWPDRSIFIWADSDEFIILCNLADTHATAATIRSSYRPWKRKVLAERNFFKFTPEKKNNGD